MNYSSRSIHKKIKALRSTPSRIGRKSVLLAFKLIVVCVVICTVMVACVGLGAFTGIIQTAPQISLDAVIGEEINGHSLSEALNIVLMRKMGLK